LLGIIFRSLKTKYKNCIGALRREKVVALKRGLESQQNVFRKQSSDSSSALRESYRVAHLLAKENNGELVRKYLQRIVQEVCPGKETDLILCVSRNEDATG
jgi:hypothetical protein